MKSINTNIENNYHGHNAPWMLPIWGVIGFVGFNSLLILGTGLGLLFFVLFTGSILLYLAKNIDRMPITIRTDDFEYFQNIRKNDPEFYNYLKSEIEYYAKEISDFEYVDKVRQEAKLKPAQHFINFNHRKRIEPAIFN